MTFTEMRDMVADRLNLTSATALTRIEQTLNERYRWVVSSLGLRTAVLTTVSANTVSGNRSVAFTGVTKIFSVFNPTPNPPVRLSEADFDFLRNQTVEATTTSPTQFAVQIMGAQSVTIFLSCVPGSAFQLQADAEKSILSLTSLASPAFSEDFHDVLVYGAMSSELEKMQRYDLAKAQEDRYEKRLGDLRTFIGK